MLTHLPWTAIPGLRHGFLDRSDPDGPMDLPIALPRQVHGTRIVVATRGSRPEADGLVTTEEGLGAGVVTADCVPVLLVDRRARAAAAVHAGWRGAAGGVLEAAIIDLGVRFGSRPEDVEAVAGPAIGGCCYEIGRDVIAAFERRTGSTTAPAVAAVNGREHLDLRTAVRLLLAAAGVRRHDPRPVHRVRWELPFLPSRRRRDGPTAQLCWLGVAATAIGACGSSNRAGSSM